MVKRYTAMLSASALLLVACNSRKSDWSAATEANTVTGYQAYLSKHGSGPYVEEARVRLAQLHDDQDWQTANTADTLEAYKHYLQVHPTGKQFMTADGAVIGLERASAWHTAKKVGTADALRAYLKRYPLGTEGGQAQQDLVLLTRYRVQLVALHNRQAAERERAKLQSRFKNVLPEIFVIAPKPGDSIYRVSSEAMSQSDADKACMTLKHDHQACEVINGDRAS